MKKLMFAFCFLFGGMIAYAQDTTMNDQQYRQDPTLQQDQNQDRERINSSDLPDAVKRSLEGQEYRGWLINAAYKTHGMNEDQMNEADSTNVMQGQDNNEDIYVVELKNGAQTKTVRFDKDGRKLEDQGMNQDQD